MSRSCPRLFAESSWRVRPSLRRTSAGDRSPSPKPRRPAAPRGRTLADARQLSGGCRARCRGPDADTSPRRAARGLIRPARCSGRHSATLVSACRAGRGWRPASRRGSACQADASAGRRPRRRRRAPARADTISARGVLDRRAGAGRARSRAPARGGEPCDSRPMWPRKRSRSAGSSLAPASSTSIALTIAASGVRSSCAAFATNSRSARSRAAPRGDVLQHRDGAHDRVVGAAQRARLDEIVARPTSSVSSGAPRLPARPRRAARRGPRTPRRDELPGAPAVARATCPSGPTTTTPIGSSPSAREQRGAVDPVGVHVLNP